MTPSPFWQRSASAYERRSASKKERRIAPPLFSVPFSLPEGGRVTTDISVRRDPKCMQRSIPWAICWR